MANGNGRDLDPALAARAQLVGPKPEIVGATVLGVVKCPCGAHPITLVSQLIGLQWMSMQVSCLVCQTPYAIQDVGSDAQGRLTFNLAVGVPPPLAG